MAGVLFIINVPQKEHEAELRKEAELNDFKLKENNGSTPGPCARVHNISKCKSTDCLNTKSDIHKTKSEVTLNLNEYLDGGKSYVKSSWEDVKNVLKLKKNKLNITGPTRGVDILDLNRSCGPARSEKLNLECYEKQSILAVQRQWKSHNGMSVMGVHNLMARVIAHKYLFCRVMFSIIALDTMVTFSLESGYVCEELLQVLRTFGIGTKHGSSLCVVPCALYYKSDLIPTSNNTDHYENSETNSAWSRFTSSVRARTNLAQVLHDVRADAALTFDWLFLLIVAAFVAAVGLMENSTVILVASMLISPLMAPITAGTLGTAVRDRSLQHMGVVHELMGLFLCLVIGFIFGLCICAVDGRYGVVDDWPTPEMMSRCELRSLFIGVLIAIPSGACVALAVLSDYTSSFVGVAISASLLPPAVNAGLLWAMALFRLAVQQSDLNWAVVAPEELAVLGTASLCLTLINIVCIFLAGVTVYKIKEVCPLERRDISWWRANKNRLQTLKRGRNDGPPTWDIYSKWCNDSVRVADSKEKDHEIQSDTVTFRRPRPNGVQRKRAQSIEKCFRTQQEESYHPLDISDTISYEIKNQEDQRKPNSHDYSYHNIGYESQKIKEQCPTIEPSLSFTVGPKRNP